MKCRNCNSELHEGSLYCTVCGTKIDTELTNSSNYTADPLVKQASVENKSEPRTTPTDNIINSVSHILNYNTDSGEQMGAGFAIASMVLGICSLVFGCCLVHLGAILGLVGLVLGAVAIKNKSKGVGMAIAGLVCSVISVGWFLIYLAIGASIEQTVKSIIDSSKYR